MIAAGDPNAITSDMQPGMAMEPEAPMPGQPAPQGAAPITGATTISDLVARGLGVNQAPQAPAMAQPGMPAPRVPQLPPMPQLPTPTGPQMLPQYAGADSRANFAPGGTPQLMPEAQARVDLANAPTFADWANQLQQMGIAGNPAAATFGTGMPAPRVPQLPPMPQLPTPSGIPSGLAAPQPAPQAPAYANPQAQGGVQAPAGPQAPGVVQGQAAPAQQVQAQAQPPVAPAPVAGPAPAPAVAPAPAPAPAPQAPQAQQPPSTQEPAPIDQPAGEEGQAAPGGAFNGSPLQNAKPEKPMISGGQLAAPTTFGSISPNRVVSQDRLTKAGLSGALLSQFVEEAQIGAVKWYKRTVDNESEAASLLYEFAKNRAQEEALMLILDGQNRPIAILRHQMGGPGSTSFAPNILAGVAAATPGAKKVYTAHNHPGRSIAFSDKDLTSQHTVGKILSFVGVEVKGVMILGDPNYDIAGMDKPRFLFTAGKDLLKDLNRYANGRPDGDDPATQEIPMAADMVPQSEGSDDREGYDPGLSDEDNITAFGRRSNAGLYDIPIVERVFTTRGRGLASVKMSASGGYAEIAPLLQNGSGLAFVDAGLNLVGVLPMSIREMGMLMSYVSRNHKPGQGHLVVSSRKLGPASLRIAPVRDADGKTNGNKNIGRGNLDYSNSPMARIMAMNAKSNAGRVIIHLGDVDADQVSNGDDISGTVSGRNMTADDVIDAVQNLKEAIQESGLEFLEVTGNDTGYGAFPFGRRRDLQPDQSKAPIDEVSRYTPEGEKALADDQQPGAIRNLPNPKLPTGDRASFREEGEAYGAEGEAQGGVEGIVREGLQGPANEDADVNETNPDDPNAGAEFARQEREAGARVNRDLPSGLENATDVTPLLGAYTPKNKLRIKSVPGEMGMNTSVEGEPTPSMEKIGPSQRESAAGASVFPRTLSPATKFGRWTGEQLKDFGLSQAMLDQFVEHSTIGHVMSGVEFVKNAGDAAHVVSYMRKNPVEEIVILVCDKNGKPLQVARHSTAHEAAACVFNPAILVGAAASTPGADTVYFIHNHPSRKPHLSGSDENADSKIRDLVKAAGLKFGATIAIAGDKFAARVNGGMSQGAVPIKPAPRKFKIPLTERRFAFHVGYSGERIYGTADSSTLGAEVFGTQPGVIFLDNNERPVATLPLSLETLAKMREPDPAGQTGFGKFVATTDRAGGLHMILYLGDVQSNDTQKWMGAANNFTKTVRAAGGVKMKHITNMDGDTLTPTQEWGDFDETGEDYNAGQDKPASLREAVEQAAKKKNDLEVGEGDPDPESMAQMGELERSWREDMAAKKEAAARAAVAPGGVRANHDNQALADNGFITQRASQDMARIMERINKRFPNGYKFFKAGMMAAPEFKKIANLRLRYESHNAGFSGFESQDYVYIDAVFEDGSTREIASLDLMRGYGGSPEFPTVVTKVGMSSVNTDLQKLGLGSILYVEGGERLRRMGQRELTGSVVNPAAVATRVRAFPAGSTELVSIPGSSTMTQQHMAQEALLIIKSGMAAYTSTRLDPNVALEEGQAYDDGENTVIPGGAREAKLKQQPTRLPLTYLNIGHGPGPNGQAGFDSPEAKKAYYDNTYLYFIDKNGEVHITENLSELSQVNGPWAKGNPDSVTHGMVFLNSKFGGIGRDHNGFMEAVAMGRIENRDGKLVMSLTPGPQRHRMGKPVLEDGNLAADLTEAIANLKTEATKHFKLRSERSASVATFGRTGTLVEEAGANYDDGENMRIPGGARDKFLDDKEQLVKTFKEYGYMTLGHGIDTFGEPVDKTGAWKKKAYMFIIDPDGMVRVSDTIDKEEAKYIRTMQKEWVGMAVTLKDMLKAQPNTNVVIHRQAFPGLRSMAVQGRVEIRDGVAYVSVIKNNNQNENTAKERQQRLDQIRSTVREKTGVRDVRIVDMSAPADADPTRDADSAREPAMPYDDGENTRIPGSERDERLKKLEERARYMEQLGYMHIGHGYDAGMFSEDKTPGAWKKKARMWVLSTETDRIKFSQTIDKVEARQLANIKRMLLEAEEKVKQTDPKDPMLGHRQSLVTYYAKRAKDLQHDIGTNESDVTHSDSAAFSKNDYTGRNPQGRVEITQDGVLVSVTRLRGNMESAADEKFVMDELREAVAKELGVSPSEVRIVDMDGSTTPVTGTETDGSAREAGAAYDDGENQAIPGGGRQAWIKKQAALRAKNELPGARRIQWWTDVGHKGGKKSREKTWLWAYDKQGKLQVINADELRTKMMDDGDALGATPTHLDWEEAYFPGLLSGTAHGRIDASEEVIRVSLTGRIKDSAFREQVKQELAEYIGADVDKVKGYDFTGGGMPEVFEPGSEYEVRDDNNEIVVISWDDIGYPKTEAPDAEQRGIRNKMDDATPMGLFFINKQGQMVTITQNELAQRSIDAGRYIDPTQVDHHDWADIGHEGLKAAGIEAWDGTNDVAWGRYEMRPDGSYIMSYRGRRGHYGNQDAKAKLAVMLEVTPSQITGFDFLKRDKTKATSNGWRASNGRNYRAAPMFNQNQAGSDAEFRQLANELKGMNVDQAKAYFKNNPGKVKLLSNRKLPPHLEKLIQAMRTIGYNDAKAWLQAHPIGRKLMENGRLILVKSPSEVPFISPLDADTVDFNGVVDGNNREATYFVGDRISQAELDALILHEVGVHMGIGKDTDLVNDLFAELYSLAKNGSKSDPDVAILNDTFARAFDAVCSLTSYGPEIMRLINQGQLSPVERHSPERIAQIIKQVLQADAAKNKETIDDGDIADFTAHIMRMYHEEALGYLMNMISIAENDGTYKEKGIIASLIQWIKATMIRMAYANSQGGNRRVAGAVMGALKAGQVISGAIGMSNVGNALGFNELSKLLAITPGDVRAIAQGYAKVYAAGKEVRVATARNGTWELTAQSQANINQRMRPNAGNTALFNREATTKTLATRSRGGPQENNLSFKAATEADIQAEIANMNATNKANGGKHVITRADFVGQEKEQVGNIDPALATAPVGPLGSQLPIGQDQRDAFAPVAGVSLPTISLSLPRLNGETEKITDARIVLREGLHAPKRRGHKNTPRWQGGGGHGFVHFIAKHGAKLRATGLFNGMNDVEMAQAAINMVLSSTDRTIRLEGGPMDNNPEVIEGELIAIRDNKTGLILALRVHDNKPSYPGYDPESGSNFVTVSSLYMDDGGNFGPKDEYDVLLRDDQVAVGQTKEAAQAEETGEQLQAREQDQIRDILSHQGGGPAGPALLASLPPTPPPPTPTAPAAPLPAPLNPPASNDDTARRVGDVLRGRYFDGISTKAHQNAERTGSAAVRAIADIIHTRPGTENPSSDRDLPKAIMTARAKYQNKFNEIMRPLRDQLGRMTSEQREQFYRELVDQITGRTNIQPGVAGHAATQLIALLKELHDYRTAAGEDLGQVQQYFPAVYNSELITANKAAFIADATRAYEIELSQDPNLTPQEIQMKAAAAAAALYRTHTRGMGDAEWSSIFNTGQGSSTENSSKERVFGRQAQGIMSKWQTPDPFYVISRYIGSAVKRAELVRRFGAEGQKWEAMSNAMEADGVPIETINEMSQLVKLAAGLGTTPLDNSERMFMDTVNLYTAAAAMGKSAMNNLYEPAAMGIRGSTVGNPFRTVNAYAETWSRFIRNLIQMLPVLGPHVGPTFWQEYGEHIGSIHNSLDDAWMSMHAMEHGMEETSPAMRWITNRVYQANLMEATENAKLQASHALGHAYILDHAGMLDGSHWIARLLKFDTRSTAEEALLELGIPKAKQDAFAAWCAMVKQTKDRAARMAMLTDGSEMARLYEEAQVRFSHQSAVRANRAHKPVFQDAVLGRLALQLMSFSYSYYSEVTDRMYRMASRAVTTRDMPAIQRISMLLPLMLSPLTVVAMGALFESKDYLFPTESSEKRKKDHWIYKLFNAASFAGAFGPKIEMATKFIARDQPPGGVAGQTIVGAGRVGKKAIELSMDDTKSQAQKEAELKAAAGRAAVAPIKGAAVIAGSALHPVAGAAAVAMTNDTGWSNELQAKPPKKGSLPPSEELPGKRR